MAHRDSDRQHKRWVGVTGATSLRYDTTDGQFIYNWKTPKKPGFCYVVTITMTDGTSIIANFKLK